MASNLNTKFGYQDYQNRITGHGTPFKASEEMCLEILRLSSFDQWPFWDANLKTKSPLELAKNGLYYSGHGDTVICFSCHGQLSDWINKLNVLEQHKEKYPHCSFVQNTDTRNVPYGNDDVADLSGTRGKSLQHFSDSLKSATDREMTSASSSFGNCRLDYKKPVIASSTTTVTPIPAPAPVAVHIPPTPRPANTLEHPATNLPVNSQTTPQKPDKKMMKQEVHRLKTFEGNWPAGSLVLPGELAKAGFYFVGPPDRVQCAFCDGRMRNWKDTDDPMDEHRKGFPACPLVNNRNAGNIQLDLSTQSVSIPRKMQEEENRSPTPSERLGIMLDKPKHPDYTQESDRINSFRTWSKTYIITPERLAQAGFFYIGYSDNVKCFFCDGGLRNWDAGDDPWNEHAKWFSRCGFLRLKKGEDYIMEVKEGTSKAGDTSQNLGLTRYTAAASAALQNETTRCSSQQITAEESSQSPAIGRRQKRNRNRNRKKKKKDLPLVQAPSMGSDKNNPASNSSRFDQQESPEDEDSDSEEDPRVDSKSLEKALDDDEELRELKTEYQKIQEERMCKICMDAECMIVFLPCGHLVSCANCAPALRNCPICRSLIKGSVRVYTT